MSGPAAVDELLLLLDGAKWLRKEIFGGDEGYKYCRVCGKRIPRVTRIWRKKCAVCGHRTCPTHLDEQRTCRRCGEEGPPGTIRAQAAR
ncbi:MAG: hypothetical protein MUF54_21385, partial [Polyangiaceae bacterium]|nr:hypothetical protein [Polyangiaceae bacterium]